MEWELSGMDKSLLGQNQLHHSLQTIFGCDSVTTASIVIFYISWWIHLLFLLTFLVYVPQSKHAHLIAGPANVYFNRLDNPGKLKPIDFEDEITEKPLV